jgi:hypothetical protein
MQYCISSAVTPVSSDISPKLNPRSVKATTCAHVAPSLRDADNETIAPTKRIVVQVTRNAEWFIAQPPFGNVRIGALEATQPCIRGFPCCGNGFLRRPDV